MAPYPTVESLKASPIVDPLSCRYGPGPPYLFLSGLRKGANINLIGRTDGQNWNGAYVEGKTKCWVNAAFLGIQGDPPSLPVFYPGIARLPVSPQYPPSEVLSATRNQNMITVEWTDIPLRPGDEEAESTQHCIVEAWRCQAGKILFEPLATDDPTVTFIGDAGSSTPSHERIFMQEKHGFAGLTEIPWPGSQQTRQLPAKDIFHEEDLAVWSMEISNHG